MGSIEQKQQYGKGSPSLSDTELTILTLLNPNFANPEQIRKIHEQSQRELVMLIKLALLFGGSFILVAIGHMYEQKGISDSEFSDIILLYILALISQSAVYAVLHGKRVAHPRYKKLKYLKEMAVPAEINPVRSAIRSYLIGDSVALRLAQIKAKNNRN